MKSEKYWKSRAVNRMFSYQQQADKVADDIAGAYIKATKQINQEVKAIFRTFQINGGLSEEEAKKLLNELPDDAKLKSLKKIVQQVKDPKQRQTLLSQINSPAYAYRIKRFEQLQKDIDEQTAQLANFEQTATRVHYVNLADEAYNRVIFDIQKGTGIGFSFSRMPVSRIEAILNQNWSGELFSERIWGRADNLNKSIQEELLAQFMTGRSYQKTAKEIEDQLAVSSMAARRLVRTESTYIANEAEMESYRECGIDKFQFVATLDMRTSDLCQQMDGKEFAVKDASPGTNVPPLHPWCRSTTIAVIDGAVTDNLKRSARDPKTGKNYKVPADMTYSQWKKEYVDKSSESGTIKNKGLAAKIGGNGIPLHEEPKLVKIIDFKDKKVVMNELIAFEKDAVKETIETACVITKDGEIWRCYGTENRVFPDTDLEGKLQGAYVSHNHPISVTEHSFSEEDYRLFKEYNLPVLRGVDEKYEYEFNALSLHRDEPAKSVFDITPEDYRHEKSIQNAKDGGVGYWRTKKK